MVKRAQNKIRIKIRTTRGRTRSYYVTRKGYKSKYKKIGKQGRYNIYEKQTTKKRKQLPRSRTRSTRPKRATPPKRPSSYIRTRKEKDIIEYIKTEGKIPLGRIRKIEKKIFKNARTFPTIDRRKIAKSINPKRTVLTDGKWYKTLTELEANRDRIYKNVIFQHVKNKKLRDSIYKHRNIILRDGSQITIRLYGRINEKVRTLYYFGDIVVTGILIEEARKLEGVFIGTKGYMEDITQEAERTLKGKGAKAVTIRYNNVPRGDIIITDMEMNYNYA